MSTRTRSRVQPVSGLTDAREGVRVDSTALTMTGLSELSWSRSRLFLPRWVLSCAILATCLLAIDVRIRAS